MITAPYNFVPLNEKVFYPFWDKNISHDIPFEDGESAMLDITVTSKTPIYIRNHYADGDSYYEDKKGNKISTEFCHFKDKTGGKQYYIPASSIKGMIRNVVEIMSFSKINIDEKLLSKPLSVRDMTQDKSTGKIFNHDMVATAKKCGFLVKDGENYFIEDCGNVVTIKENEIRYLIPDYNKDIETAKEKYSQFGHNDNFSFSKMQKDRRTIALYSQNGEVGSLVMTGFIDNKKNEFIFKTTGKKVSISKTVYEDFQKVYFENEDAIDGQYWKKEWKRGSGRKVPIFYIEKDKQVSAIGLTQIFKLAYKKTLLDASYQTTEKDRLDLAETMFGTVRESMALKGRIQFSHLKSTHVSYESQKSEILGSPQATYYPNYLEQMQTNGNKVNTYTTLMDATAKISGYKRYPLHKGIKKSFIPKEEKTDIQTKFKPLSSGVVFHGKVRFHNLKKVEIGALLSALTFHGHDGYRHNLGMAKSLGYGKINIEIKLKNLNYKKEEYLKAYEEEMTIFQDDWVESSQLKELFAMANDTIVTDKSLEYQKLENPTTRDKEKNDFVRAKKSRDYLQRYSQIGNVNQSSLNSFVDKKEVELKKKVREEELKRLELLEKEQKAKELLIEQEKAKKRAEEKKWQDKWEAVQRVDKKYKKKALEDYLRNYPNSTKAEEAKKELEQLTSKKEKVKEKDNNSNSIFASAKSVGELNSLANSNKATEINVKALEESIIEIYKNTKKKKITKFLEDIKKKKKIIEWLGSDDRVDEIIKGK